jgi:hypothetical protein
LIWAESSWPSSVWAINPYRNRGGSLPSDGAAALPKSDGRRWWGQWRATPRALKGGGDAIWGVRGVGGSLERGFHSGTARPTGNGCTGPVAGSKRPENWSMSSRVPGRSCCRGRQDRRTAGDGYWREALSGICGRRWLTRCFIAFLQRTAARGGACMGDGAGDSRCLWRRPSTVCPRLVCWVDLNPRLSQTKSGSPSLIYCRPDWGRRYFHG